MAKKPTKHLGDEVYASVYNDTIEIRVGSPKDEPVVFLDPYVMGKLVEYARKVGVLPSEEEKE